MSLSEWLQEEHFSALSVAQETVYLIHGFLDFSGDFHRTPMEPSVDCSQEMLCTFLSFTFV